MAELGDAADSKSAVLKGAWGFNSPSRHKGGSAPLISIRFFNTIKNLHGGRISPRPTIDTAPTKTHAVLDTTCSQYSRIAYANVYVSEGIATECKS